MIGFDFGMTAGVSQSSTRKQLAGNNIYEVKFEGCEARDIQGVKDPNQVYKVLDIKFSNEEGTFTDTIFEPRETDFQRVEGQYGPQPSNVEYMMIKFKHLIDAVNPTLAEKINKKESSIKAPNWDALRQVMIKATDPGKGVTTHIKLLSKKNSNGMEEAVFPRYFARVYDDVPRLINNFIGEKLVFTASEQKRINDAQNAKPKEVEAFPSVTDNVTKGGNTDPFTGSTDTFDMPF